MQRPGRLIRWVPLIQSIPGSGKQVLIANVLSAVLGSRNVSKFSMAHMSGRFNAMPDGIVMVMEDFRLTGKNALVRLDNLKPMLTDASYALHRKYSSPTVVPNYRNAIAFCNKLDAVLIEQQDRRICFINSAFQQKSDLEDAGFDAVFWRDMVQSIERHAPEFRQYFLDFPIAPEFENFEQAPPTHAKDTARLNQLLREDPTDGRLTDMLLDRFAIRSSDILKLTNAKRLPTRLLSDMGYSPMRMRIDGKKVRIWTKNLLASHDNLREEVNRPILFDD